MPPQAVLVQRHGIHRIAPAENAVRSQSSSPRTTLRLAPWQFRALWVAVVLVSFFNGLLGLVFVGVYYGGLTIRDGYMVESVGLLSLRYIPYVLVAYLLVALYFWSVTWEAVAASIRARQLLLHRVRSPDDPSSSLWLVRKWRALWHLWSSLFAPGGLLELTPESFEFLFLVRECIEVTTQSYQAYKCSTLIAQQWINTFYVAMLTANCWVAPLIHVLARRDATLQRFLYVCSDVVLDFASTLVIPVCIISSVVLAAFDDNIHKASGGEYAFDVPYDDVTLMYQVKSAQQICVVSWVDFVTKMMPFYSMASCIGHIKHLVEPPFSSTNSIKPKNAHALLSMSGKSTSFRQRVLSGLRESTRRVSARTSPRNRARVNRICQNRVVRFLLSVKCIHTLFTAWGFFVLACHLHAQHVSDAAPPIAKIGCKSHSQPWLQRDYSCTILEINCYRRQIQGLAHELDAALAPLNPHGLASLIITHCPQLHIPPRVQTLRNLLGFEVTNATLVSWPPDAALRQSTNPALQYLCLVRTNMSAVPDGLQARDFPKRLRDISIVASNLTHMPNDLHLKWRRLLNLYIERTQVSTFPATVAHMHAGRLSLLGNGLTQIPDDAFGDQDTAFQVLSIARNPMTELPASIGRLDELQLVVMDYTRVATLPAWLLDEGERRDHNTPSANKITVSAGGSPLCLHGSYASPRGLVVVCREKQDFEFEAYPLTFNREIRPL